MSFDFRKEEDVKEYLKNIGVEYRFGCYSEKKPEVCHLLGMYFNVIKRDAEKAKKIYKVNCDTYGWSHSCYQYAYLINSISRDLTKPKLDEIIQYFTKGCENGLDKSCYLAGVKIGLRAEHFDKPKEKPANFMKALEYMNKACDDKLAQACFNLSSIYFNGIPEGNVQRDLKKVLEYSLKACEYKHFNACVNASLMYKKGEGTEKNAEKAKYYKSLAEDVYKQMTEGGITFEEGIN